MASKISDFKRSPPIKTGDVDALYGKFVRLFYEEQDRGAAQTVAKQLEGALARRPEIRNSIRGEEIRSLLAELRGDLSDAISSREAEIRKILELHSLVANTASAAYAFRKYDHSDLSDRLDLLATLYAERGDFGRAVLILMESKQFCEAHRIAFDGEDLLRDYEKAAQKSKKKASARPSPARHA